MVKNAIKRVKRELVLILPSVSILGEANGQWSMANTQWSMVNAQWSMVNAQWSMLNGQCSMLPPELLQLLETMPVDNLLQTPVGVMTNHALVVEDHHLAFFRIVWFPFGQPLGVRVPRMSEGGPRAAHQVGQLKVLICWLWQLIFRMLKRVEAKLQFMSVDRTIVDGRSPCEHIYVSVGPAIGGNMVGSDDCLRSKKPVDTQQVLRHIMWISRGPGLSSFRDRRLNAAVH